MWNRDPRVPDSVRRGDGRMIPLSPLPEHLWAASSICNFHNLPLHQLSIPAKWQNVVALVPRNRRRMSILANPSAFKGKVKHKHGKLLTRVLREARAAGRRSIRRPSVEPAEDDRLDKVIKPKGKGLSTTKRTGISFSPYNKVVTFVLTGEERRDKQSAIDCIDSIREDILDPTYELEGDSSWMEAKRNLEHNRKELEDSSLFFEDDFGPDNRDEDDDEDFVPVHSRGDVPCHDRVTRANRAAFAQNDSAGVECKSEIQDNNASDEMGLNNKQRDAMEDDDAHRDESSVPGDGGPPLKKSLSIEFGDSHNTGAGLTPIPAEKSSRRANEVAHRADEHESEEDEAPRGAPAGSSKIAAAFAAASSQQTADSRRMPIVPTPPTPPRSQRQHSRRVQAQTETESEDVNNTGANTGTNSATNETEMDTDADDKTKNEILMNDSQESTNKSDIVDTETSDVLADQGPIAEVGGDDD
eukprot:Selendium_serpulae@DN5915_c0_g1_i1.p1